MQYRRILVVDDSSVSRNSLRVALEDEGHEVVEAQCASEALDSIQDQQPDLLITDLHMPGMDGLQIVMSIRKTGIDCPVIVVTTDSSSKLAQAGKRLGVDGWVRKPFEVRKLRDAVNLLTERQDRARGALND